MRSRPAQQLQILTLLTQDNRQLFKGFPEALIWREQLQAQKVSTAEGGSDFGMQSPTIGSSSLMYPCIGHAVRLRSVPTASCSMRGSNQADDQMSNSRGFK